MASDTITVDELNKSELRRLTNYKRELELSLNQIKKLEYNIQPGIIERIQRVIDSMEGDIQICQEYIDG